MPPIEAPADNKRAFSSATIEETTRGVLKAAGWAPGAGKGKTIWRNPPDARWYDELRALAVLREGADPGASD